MSYRVAIITVSDKGSKGERVDLSGPALRELAEKSGFEVVGCQIVPDEFKEISDILKSISDSSEADLILTTGGTGFGKRDITPEATKSILEKEVPGLSEMIRSESSKITNRAYLSRGVSGIRKKTLIVNLPGSKKAATESFEIILPILGHGLEVLKKGSAECGRMESKKHI